MVYIEPYPKSRTEELHSDAMVDASKTLKPAQLAPGSPPKVRFRLFSGVAPRRFAALFEKRDELKQNGRWVAPNPELARHRDPVLDKSFLELEQRIAEIAEKAEQEGGLTHG